MTEREDKKLKKLKHRPNQKGVGMRTLNEHDADSYDEYFNADDWKEVDEGPEVFLDENNQWQRVDGT